jgi:1-acyl-sn-glycerol-3-phosphate acyltransferase
VVVDGKLSEEPVLYAIKHEAMFETIDMPRLFHLPAVITKKRIVRYPGMGSARRKAYGMIPVDREAGPARCVQ